MAKTNQISSSEITSRAKHYFYPNIYYFLATYAIAALIVVVIFPFEASFESVIGVGILSLSALIVSLVAGPVYNTKTVENTWLRNAAASSFVTTFTCLIVGTSLAILDIASWQLVNFAIIGVAVFDLLGKLVIAKKRDS